MPLATLKLDSAQNERRVPSLRAAVRAEEEASSQAQAGVRAMREAVHARNPVATAQRETRSRRLRMSRFALAIFRVLSALKCLLPWHASQIVIPLLMVKRSSGNDANGLTWCAFRFPPRLSPQSWQVKLSRWKTAFLQSKYSELPLIAFCFGVIPPFHLIDRAPERFNALRERLILSRVTLECFIPSRWVLPFIFSLIAALCSGDIMNPFLPDGIPFRTFRTATQRHFLHFEDNPSNRDPSLQKLITECQSRHFQQYLNPLAIKALYAFSVNPTRVEAPRIAPSLVCDMQYS